MKTDNTLKLFSKLTASAHELINSELLLLGHGAIAPSHGEILIALYCNGELSMQDIALRIHRTPSTVTTLVNKLITLGYVTTAKCCNDSRSTTVSLTELGRGLQPQFMAISAKIYHKYYAGFSHEEYEIFRILLEKMYNQVCENNSISN